VLKQMMPMRILFISNLYPPHTLGGYEILCGQVADELKRRGHEIIILTSTHGVAHGASSPLEPGVNRLLDLYVPFATKVGVKRWKRRKTGRRNYQIAGKIIARERPDLVFVWSQLRLTLGAARAAQHSGTPLAFTFNDEHIAGFLPAPLRLSPRGVAAYVADRYLCREITLHGINIGNATCISECVKKNLSQRGVPVGDAAVIYQGIELDAFPVRVECRTKPRRTRVLFVGQLHCDKGVHTLIDAAHVIATVLGPDAVRVSIVGSGSSMYEQRLRQLAQHGSAQIDFLGQVARCDLSRIYREHDIFVFPSIWAEPFGLTHLEAMASGLPVVSTADGGHGEFLQHQVNALVFEKGNAAQLAQHIITLSRSHQQCRRLAANARAMVETRFSLRRYVADLETFLYDALEVDVR